MFGTRNALKKHVGGPAHSRLTVICPWCFKRERTFTRLADMKFHALNTHSNEGLQDGYFGRGVGFYYSKYPEDYVKLVDEVAGYADENACKARSVMRKWAESMVNKEEMLERLNKGWKTERRGRSKSKEPARRQREEVKEKRDSRRVVEKRLERSEPDEAGDRRREMEVEKEKVEENNKRTAGEEVTESTKRRRVEPSGGGEEDDLKDYEDDITLEEVPSESSDSDSEEEPEEKETDVPVGLTDIRIRASKLLMHGVMPLCPPAPRDWSKVEEVSLETTCGNLVWPPKGWTKLSADQKLLAQEHAAMCLEQSRAKKGTFVQELSRRALLDKYNFLTLEGAARPKIGEGPARTDAKARYYQYSLLSDIARGRAADSRLTQSVVKCLELAERWRDTDYFTKKLDATGVKLRV